MVSIYATKSSAGSYVNRIGKYLKQNMEGAYKIKFSPMECEVFFHMMFEVPGDRESFGEISFIISIVSYQNKLRINITEISDREKTIGQIILKDVDLENMNDFLEIRMRIIDLVNKFLEKEYPGYYLVY